MTTHALTLKNIHPSWHDCIIKGLQHLNADYLQHLTESQDWLPGAEKIFNAFTLPLANTNYVLFGESPYPRAVSANGYAFWDADVNELWSSSGLSKKVNRATSLRNIIKMLLIADHLLDPANMSQLAISRIDKEHLVKTNHELFQNLLHHGFLLLNATLVLQPNSPPQHDARAWQPFIKTVLACLLEQRPTVQLILMGKIATTIDQIVVDKKINKICVEHPYNLSFITNPKVLDFFRPLHLLNR